MPQYDVHRNPGAGLLEKPDVDVTQSKRFEQSRRRLVVPLLRGSQPSRMDESSAPVVQVQSEALIFGALQIQSIDTRGLGPALAHPESEGDRILRAIDEVISRA